MKISIRVYQETNDFQVDAEPSDTIGALKVKIHESQGYPIEKQSILFCARVPTDERTLESCRISDKGFIVLLMEKPRPPDPDPVPVDISEFSHPSAQHQSTITIPPDFNFDAFLTPPPSPLPMLPAPVFTPTPAPTSVISAPRPRPRPRPAPAPAPAPVSTPTPTPISALPPVYTPAPAPVVSAPTPILAPAAVPMHTPASVVSNATTSASTPSDGSVITGDVLQTSIDSMVEMGFPRDQVLRALSANSNNPDRALEYLLNGVPTHAEVQTASPASVPPVGRPPDSSQIAELRALLTQNPELAQAAIQHLAASNPELAQLFQNPEMLQQVLNAIGGEGGSDLGAQIINATADDRAAIERLEVLGFPRRVVIEAYLACDKNEQHAANYLLEGDS